MRKVEDEKYNSIKETLKKYKEEKYERLTNRRVLLNNIEREERKCYT